MQSSHFSFSDDFRVFSSVAEAEAAFPDAKRILPVVYIYPYNYTPQHAATQKTTADLRRWRLGDVVPAVPGKPGTFFWYSPHVSLPPSCTSKSTFTTATAIGEQTITDYATALGAPLTAGKTYEWTSTATALPPVAFCLAGEWMSPFFNTLLDCSSISATDSTDCTDGAGGGKGWGCV